MNLLHLRFIPDTYSAFFFIFLNTALPSVSTDHMERGSLRCKTLRSYALICLNGVLNYSVAYRYQLISLWMKRVESLFQGRTIILRTTSSTAVSLIFALRTSFFLSLSSILCSIYLSLSSELFDVFAK